MRPPIPTFSVSRRGRIAIGIVAVLLFLATVANSLVGVFIDWLWFGEVGYRGVFSSILQTRIILILVFGLLMALIIGGNVLIVYLVKPPFRPLSPEQQNLERYRVTLESRKKLAFGGLLALMGLAAGLSAQTNWQAWMLWHNGGDFGVKDPQFGMDISFFAFDYPIYRLILGFAFSAVIFSLLLSVALHYLFGSIRLQTPGPKISNPARRHLTALVFVFIALKAVAYWLDRYGLVYSDRGQVTGASYTDVNASLPAKTILFWIAVVIALFVLASIWLKSARLPGIAFAVLLILSIVINGIYPALVQQITVKPNASDREAKYISRNIAATRSAYGVADAGQGGPVTYGSFSPGKDKTPDTSALVPSNPTVSNIRILDPNQISSTVSAQQQLQNFYGFPNKLDIDRYTLPDPATGQSVTKDYVVAVRELESGNLLGDQTNWINKYTVLTHGYGFVAAPANQDVTNPPYSYTEQNIPQTGPLNIKVPQVYYGELPSDYAVVGAAGTREQDGKDGKDSYGGAGGIKLDSLLTRLAFAAQYKETNFLLNDAVTSPKAKVMIVRDPRERVQKVAPFLKIDGDPYPVVDTDSGRIVWMVDGYTTMATYPYSEKNSLEQMTSDSLTKTSQTAALPNDQVNYIRNSVKATVDAFDGTVKLYKWDDKDPLINAWSKAFKGLLLPRSSMPKALADHVRYPQDLFEVQRYMLEKYHVSDPVQFYNQVDKWTVPSDPVTPSSNQPPYYVLASALSSSANASDENGTAPEFQLTSPMKVNGRPYLAAYVSVDSDPDPSKYGKITVLRLPSDSNVNGPEQVYQAFNANAVISKDISLLSGQGSSILHGNLLTLPIGNSFLYVEPLYVKATTANAYPVLQRVLVDYGGKIGYGVTLAQALANLNDSTVGAGIVNGATSGNGSATPTPTPPTSSPKPGTTPAPPAGDVGAILSQLDAAFANLQNAYKTGDLAKIGEAQAQLQALTKQYLNARAAATPTPVPTLAAATPTPAPAVPTPTPKP